MSAARFARTLLVSACFLLALPALAAAATYTVDSTGDQGDEPGVGCETSAGTCTLRAALTESNNSAGTRDTILFAASFDGSFADTIEPQEALPKIVDPVTIDADGVEPCLTDANIEGPCAAVAVEGSFPSLQIEADDVTIEGLAIAEGTVGIDALPGSTGLQLRGNWIGVELDGSNGGNSTGVRLGSESNGATIGGTAAVDRNVISNYTETGIHVLGSDETRIRGNYVGVRPNGVDAARGKYGVVVSDQTNKGYDSTNTEIGATAEGSALQTKACDGGCNVVAGTVAAMYLGGHAGGENGPSGPTTVHGNYVNLGADGVALLAVINSHGISASTSDALTVGGPVAGDANFVVGGNYGFFDSQSTDLVVRNNVFGLGGDRVLPLPVGGRSISVNSNEAILKSDAPEVAANTISMTAGWGIEIYSTAARVVGNEIEGADLGIETYGGPGDLIEGNLIEAPGEAGIRLANEDSVAIGNTIRGSAGAGIVVRRVDGTLVSGNRIGGEEADEENAIFDSAGDAILVIGAQSSQTEVARNHGSGNGDLFIDLSPINPKTESVGPNGGVKPPAIAVAEKGEAAGSGQKGSLVRVFVKISAAAGELGAFLGQTEVEGDGTWSLSYSVPGGTMIAATQTTPKGGTSELSPTATVAADPGPPPPPPCAPMLPVCGIYAQATITAWPKPKSTKTTAIFQFTSSAAGSTFACKLDKKAWARCGSPKIYKKLKPGKHVFQVRAVDGDGIAGPIAKRVFRVMRPGR